MTDATGSLRYLAEKEEEEDDDEARRDFLLERYTAFTEWRGVRRFFRVWHGPWPARRLRVEIAETSLLEQTGDWISQARFVGAHYSPGVQGVWMGHPQFL